MIECETIARAICQTGKCAVCDEDCLDYRAAQRVMKVLDAEHDTIVEKFASNLRACYCAPMYQEKGAHTMIIKLFANIDDVVKEMRR